MKLSNRIFNNPDAGAYNNRKAVTVLDDSTTTIPSTALADGVLLQEDDRALFTALSDSTANNRIYKVHKNTFLLAEDGIAVNGMSIPGDLTFVKQGSHAGELWGYEGADWELLDVDITDDGGTPASSGADVNLSNLVDPTLLPVSLNFDSLTGDDFKLDTTDVVGGGSSNIIMNTGTSDTDPTGAISVFTGDSLADDSGTLDLSTGASPSRTGDMSIKTGDASPGGASGDVQVRSGNAHGESGSLQLLTGPTSGDSSNDSGQLDVQTGNVDSGSGTSGDIRLRTGNNDGTGDSGDIELKIGNVTSGDKGVIKLQDGTEGTPGDIWTQSASGDGTGHWETPSSSGADTDLNNLTTTSINQDLLPSGDVTRALGSGGLRWNGIFVTTVKDTAGVAVLDVTNRTINNSSTILIDFAGTTTDFQNKKISNVANPTLSQDVATKDYVDTSQTDPGGSDKQVQFNDGGAFGGAAGLTFDKTTKALTQGTSCIASGINSHAEGNNTEAIGDSSHASGLDTIADGTASTAIGASSWSEGIYSLASGNEAETHGQSGFASGEGVISDGYTQTVVGRYNIQQGTSGSFVSGDESLIIGNGISAEARHNAFSVSNDAIMKLYGTTSGHMGQKVPATTTNYDITWPAAQGGVGTFPTNNGSGGLSWGSSAVPSGTAGGDLNGTYPNPSIDTQFKQVPLTATFDGSGSAITVGKKVYVTVPYAGTITQWVVLADQSGSIVVDVWKAAFASYPPLVGGTIAGTELPTLSATDHAQDTNLTTWSTSVAAGDVLAFNVNSCSTITWASVQLLLTKT